MKTTLPWLPRLVGVALLIWLAAAIAAMAAPYQEEQTVDRELGLLNHPWKINLVSLRTSDYLRLRSQVKTGLQSYDQQVERANESPAELIKKLSPVVVPAPGGQEKPTAVSPQHPPGWEPPPVIIHIGIDNP